MGNISILRESPMQNPAANGRIRLARTMRLHQVVMFRLLIPMFPAILGLYWPFCTPELRPTQPPDAVRMEELWERPDDLERRDLFFGPWGAHHAPAPDVVYTFVKLKTSGVNPGMTVRDPDGREWRVKQAPHDGRGHEGPIEVVMSRILSAAGYHQPPVYFLPSFTLVDSSGTRREPGGRFRLDHEALKELGSWSWQQNPFVGTQPYQGLLVILMMLNSSDIKNSNNTLYETRSDMSPRRWFVVRDLGTALGSTGRFEPKRGDIGVFENEPMLDGIENGFVKFNYGGWHQELVTHRIRVDDVAWASELLGRISEQQWKAAFRAGGYDDALTQRFIRRIATKIDEGRDLKTHTAGG
jgi:hypothetical protein